MSLYLKKALCLSLAWVMAFCVPVQISAAQPNKLAPKSSFPVKKPSNENQNISELLYLLGAFWEENASRMKVGDSLFFDGQPVRIVHALDPSDHADLETPFLEFQDKKTQERIVLCAGDFEMLARLSFLPDGQVQSSADRWIDRVDSITCLLDNHHHAAAIGVLDRSGKIPLMSDIQEKQVTPKVLYDLENHEANNVEAIRDRAVELAEGAVALEDLRHYVFLHDKQKGLTFENIDFESEIAKWNTLFEEESVRLDDAMSQAEKEYALREILQQARLCKTLLFLQRVGIFSKAVAIDDACGKIVAITPRYDPESKTLMFKASFEPTLAPGQAQIVEHALDADFLPNIRFVQSGLSRFFAEKLEDYDVDAEIFRLKLLERYRHAQSPWEDISPKTFLDYLTKWLPEKTLSGLSDKPLTILGVTNAGLRSPGEITLALKVLDPVSGKRESLVIGVGMFEMMKAILRWKLSQETQKQGPISATAAGTRPVSREPILDSLGNVQLYRRDAIAGEIDEDPQLVPLFAELENLYAQEYPQTQEYTPDH